MINLAKTDKLLEKLLYRDKLNVYKSEKVILSDGSSQVGLQAFAEYEDIPCKLSFDSKDASESFTMENQVLIVTSIFISLAYELSAGDYLEATRTDSISGKITTYTGYAGEPNRKENHQELELVKKGMA